MEKDSCTIGLTAVCSCTGLSLVLEEVCLDWRIRQKTQVVTFLVNLVVEEMFIQVKA